MLEHVGVEHYPTPGRRDRPLPQAERPRADSFDRREPAIPPEPMDRTAHFPGANPPSLGEMMRLFEPSKFSILDVENLRLHYAKTLEQLVAAVMKRRFRA